MQAKNATMADMEQALAMVNRRFGANVKFFFCVGKGRGINFRLAVRNSRGDGARRGFTGRAMTAACWHVHGHFFEALLKVNPEVTIISRAGPGAVIDKTGGNWQDRNIGSLFSPLMYSDACECNGSARLMTKTA